MLCKTWVVHDRIETKFVLNFIYRMYNKCSNVYC